MTSDAYKRTWLDVMFSYGSNKSYNEALILVSCLLTVCVNNHYLTRVNLTSYPTTPLEKCLEGDTCVVASPARIQHYFGDHDSCRVQRTPGDGCLDRTTAGGFSASSRGDPVGSVLSHIASEGRGGSVIVP